jgi:hypothetical protein
MSARRGSAADRRSIMHSLALPAGESKICGDAYPRINLGSSIWCRGQIDCGFW